MKSKQVSVKANKSTIDFRSKISTIRWVLFLSVLIMGVKFLAYYHSGSQAILSDALESFINIATSLFTMYSLWYGSRLKDADHPYGHGKMEYFAVGVEGTLIFGTGIYIVYRSVHYLLEPHALMDVDLGLILTVVSVVSMWSIGKYLDKKGRELDSMPLRADGAHFKADAVTSIGLLGGLGLYKLTGWYWVDPVLAMLLAFHIIFSGYKLIREAGDRLMDRTDFDSIQKVGEILQDKRKPSWIDIHNLRLQKFGHYLHVDCHLTLPYFLSLDEAHHEVKLLEKELNKGFHNHVELFVHTDPCSKNACNICSVEICPSRKSEFIRHVEWNTHNLTKNHKHSLSSSK